jgi:hypothetical protein
MVNGNGHAAFAPLPRKTVTFQIGGEDVQVRALGFLDLDENEALRTALDALSPEIPPREYLRHVMTIVSNQMVQSEPEWGPDQLNAARAHQAEAYMQALLAGEGAGVIGQMGELLRVSGFRLPEPAVTETAPGTENPGTGTSTDSSPASPSEASAEATPS